MYLVFTEDVPLVEFMYLVFTEDVPLVEFMYLVSCIYRGCTSGGVYVPCIYRGCTSGGVYVPCIYRECTSGGVYVPCKVVCKVRVTIGDSGLCCYTCVCYVFRALISSLVHCTGNKLCVEPFSFLLCLLTQFL